LDRVLEIGLPSYLLHLPFANRRMAKIQAKGYKFGFNQYGSEFFGMLIMSRMTGLNNLIEVDPHPLNFT